MDSFVEFMERLDEKIGQKHLLTHPFYQAWSRGELSKPCLIEYAKDYYHHVLAFPTYLSALHSRTQDPETRKEILQNLIDEEAGEPNHPELWKNFTLHLGATPDEIWTHSPSSEIKDLITNFRQSCNQGGVLEGIAALYAYESQIPTVSLAKIEGLKTHYRMNNPESWKYFSVHIEADALHSEVERGVLEKHFSKKEAKKALERVDAVLDHLWNFLSRLSRDFPTEQPS